MDGAREREHNVPGGVMERLYAQRARVMAPVSTLYVTLCQGNLLCAIFFFSDGGWPFGKKKKI